MSDAAITGISAGSEVMYFEQDGEADKASYSFFRGGPGRLHPTDRSIASSRVLRYFFDGLMPARPFIDSRTPIVAFGSCFAAHIADYLQARGCHVLNRQHRAAYITSMGDGIVNTFALRQQFEWAWEGRQPAVDLWHDYDARVLGYDEQVRLDTREMFDVARVFIVTLGLSEIWYDAPTGEVFWRVVPQTHFDASRHRFRLATYEENLENLDAIRRLIRTHRPDAALIVTLSPIPLKATFRDLPCVVANATSKALLRAAIDTFLSRHATDPGLYYFPSFEVAQHAFQHPFMEDRRHVHKHVLDFNMAAFERYYRADGGIDDADLLDAFRKARVADEEVVRHGHWAVPRSNLLFHTAPPGARVFGGGPPGTGEPVSGA